MDDIRETRIREYERWVCEALALDPPEPDPRPEAQADRDNLVAFPRDREPAAPQGR